MAILWVVDERRFVGISVRGFLLQGKREELQK
jgi:hypothetical protein